MATHPTITLGSTGPAVTLAQQQLFARGFDPGVQDGTFGVDMDQAVRHYQDERSVEQFLPLVMDGIVGPATWARLDPATIKKGAKGALVKLLQERLNEDAAVVGSVTVDGVFGPATEQGVKTFQGIQTLTIDGIVGPRTWTALGS